MGVLHDLVDEVLALRAWTHERHVAHKHVPQLGEFVDVVLAEKTLKLRRFHTVALRHELRTLVFHHSAQRAELVDGERLATIADTLLSEKHRTVFLDNHDEGDDKEHREEDDKSEQGTDKIRDPLHAALKGIHCIVAVCQARRLLRIYSCQSIWV